MPVPIQTVGSQPHRQMASPQLSVWAGCLVTLSASEILGPFCGWPTISSFLIAQLHLDYEHSNVLPMLLALTPQLIITFFAASTLWKTRLLHWVRAEGKTNKNIIARDLRLASNLTGVLVGFFICLLLALQLGSSLHSRPANIGALRLWEAGLFIFLALLATIRLKVTEGDTIHIPDPGEEVVRRLRQAADRSELDLDHATFSQSIVLKVAPEGLLLCQSRETLRLDTADHILINLGLLRKHLHTPVNVTSTSHFQATGKFVLPISMPIGHTTALDRGAVEYLINNFYMAPNLPALLKPYLSIAMDSYVRKLNIPEPKELLENFRKDVLELKRTKVDTKKDLGPANNVELIRRKLNDAQQDTEKLLAKLEKFGSDWRKIRVLQHDAKTDFPAHFAKYLVEAYSTATPKVSANHQSSLNSDTLGESRTNTAVETVHQLLDWGKIGFQVETFELSDGSAVTVDKEYLNAISTAQTEIERIQSELDAIQQSQNAENQTRLESFLVVIDDAIKAFDVSRPAQLAAKGRLLAIRGEITLTSDFDELRRRIEKISEDAHRSGSLPQLDSEQVGVAGATEIVDAELSDISPDKLRTRRLGDFGISL